MQGSMGSEMEDPRNTSLAMKSPMAMAPADVETDPIISHPVRINNSTTADPYYLNSQYVNTPYNNIVDEEIRNSSKSAPVAYREDYFRYPYYKYETSLNRYGLVRIMTVEWWPPPTMNIPTLMTLMDTTISTLLPEVVYCRLSEIKE